jgi:hypothetical protein
MYMTLSSLSWLWIPPYRSTVKGFESSAACFRAATNTVFETPSSVSPVSHYSYELARMMSMNGEGLSAQRSTPS